MSDEQVIDLTRDKPRPVRVETDFGDVFRFTFKRRLNRQQATMMTKKVGRGSKAQEVPDLRKMYTSTIESIEIIRWVELEEIIQERGGSEGDKVRLSGADTPVAARDHKVTDPDLIFALMNEHLPITVTEQVDDYVLGLNSLKESLGNG